MLSKLVEACKKYTKNTPIKNKINNNGKNKLNKGFKKKRNKIKVNQPLSISLLTW